jgi:hypothetical protein
MNFIEKQHNVNKLLNIPVLDYVALNQELPKRGGKERVEKLLNLSTCGEF